MREPFAGLAIVLLAALPCQGREDRVREGVEPIFLAASVAYADFQGRISKSNGTSELNMFLSNIENYRITLYLRDGHYIIDFYPKLFKGARLRGGDGHYEVNAKSIKIDIFEPMK